MTEEPTNFLYPFLDAQEDDPQSLLADLTASAQAKAAESLALRRSTLDENAELLAAAAAEMARRFAAGGRLFTFGNGGSCTDSIHAGKTVRAAADRRAAAVLVVDRRSGNPHRAGQRRRIRAGVRPATDRPRKRRGYRHCDVDQRQFTQSDGRADGGPSPRSVHRRLRRLRRGRLREEPGCRRLLRRSVTKRAPHPGSAGAAGLPAVADCT